jgi:hypothetical protein
VKSLSSISEGIKKNKLWMWENDSCRKVIYMGNVHSAEKVNSTCVRSIYVGKMDRGFTVL